MRNNMEKEWEEQDFRLKYCIRDTEVEITDYHGMALSVVIPDYIEELPVTVIAKKVFLSKKRLRRVVLPMNLRELGDWAFAYCSNLEEIIFPQKEFSCGKAIFLDCHALKKIGFSDSEHHVNDDVGVLMATALTRMEAYYLFEPVHAGDGEWLEKWDFRLKTLIEEDDLEGYTKTILCGEEDYGSKENNIDYFLNQKRQEKARLSMIRLLHPPGLQAEWKEALEEYLRCHTKNKQTDGKKSEEAWEVVLQEHPDSRRYFELLGATGCITEENVDGMLLDLGDSHAEMKAFLLKYQSDYLQKEDFFDSLSLDF